MRGARQQEASGAARRLPAAAVGLQVGLFLLVPSVQLRYGLLTIYAALAGLCVAAGAHRAVLARVLWTSR